ncbi:unnamed protein product [Allacma fusca]|uniref:Treslin STD domain-containing protein n=1 Tax=Allacma fusca TaxID=39272 RepID=A0A8J2KQ53_9HEXA|nr:unnamed protein product [Allacma fusca]
MSINIAVLLDLNSFPPGADIEVQHKHLKWIHEHILNLVSTTASDESTNEVDYSKILWSYKYYNSSKDVDYRSKKFEPFSIGTFEGFESSSLSEYDRYRSCSDVQESSENNKCSCLSQALMRLTSDLRWEESTCKKAKPSNIIYTILRVPRDEDELVRFTDANEDYLSSPNSRSLLSALLPSAFLKAFHGKHSIQLNFIDTWVLHKEENLESDWNGTAYSKNVGKVLEYLNKGTIIQLQKAQPAPPGLPSYFNLLKNSLKAATATKVTPVSEKLSEAQKLLQHNRQTDSARSKQIKHLGRERDMLNMSMDSQRSSNRGKCRKDKNIQPMFKDNRGRSTQKLYTSLQESYGITSADSSTSEDYGSQVFSRRQEIELSKLISLANGKKGHHHSQRLMKPKSSGHHSSRSRCMQPPAQKRLRRHSPPRSSIDGDSILSGPAVYSRAAQLLGLATDKERKKWLSALKKETEERDALLKERNKVLGNFSTLQRLMNTRLSMYLEKMDLKDSANLDLLLPSIKDFKEQCTGDESLCILSVCQTVVPFVVERLQKNNIIGQPAKEILENTLYIPIADLRASILKVKNDEAELAQIFRECQLQILIRMEVAWLLPQEVDSSENLRDEIVDLLSLLAVYIKKAVDDFLANVIVQAYMETHSELLIRLYRGLNLDPPRNLLLQVTPSKSIRSRCSFQGSSIKSPFGSSESLFAPPPSQPACKQISKAKGIPLKREESFVSTKSSARYASHVYVNNPKKMVMVPRGNIKKLGSVPKSPKPGARSSRVRRNLFDDDGSQNKSPLCLTRLSRSPSIGLSRKSIGGSLTSPRVRAVRSKRKLNLDDHDGDRVAKNSNSVSPDMFSRSIDSNILCPATPSDKSFHSTRKRKFSSSGKSSCEKVILESPECPKTGNTKSFAHGLNALSFYSTGSDSFRSRAWEKSGNKLMAAKIKRKIDSSSFMNSGLTLSDLEIIGGGSVGSPESKSAVEEFQSPLRISSIKRSPDHQEPCCSKSMNDQSVEVAHGNVNASIEALIRGAPSLALLKTTPKAVAATPTKKISFNFDESLIKTPNRSSPGTPKSILKTPNRGDESGRKTYSVIGTPLKATHFQAEAQSSKSSLEAASKDSLSAEQIPSEGSSSVSQGEATVEQQIPNIPAVPLLTHNDVSLGIVSLAGSENMTEVRELQSFTPQCAEPSFLSLLNFGYENQYQYNQPAFYGPQFVAMGFPENYLAPPPNYPPQYLPSGISTLSRNRITEPETPQHSAQSAKSEVQAPVPFTEPSESIF